MHSSCPVSSPGLGLQPLSLQALATSSHSLQMIRMSARKHLAPCIAAAQPPIRSPYYQLCSPCCRNRKGKTISQPKWTSHLQQALWVSYGSQQTVTSSNITSLYHHLKASAHSYDLIAGQQPLRYAIFNLVVSNPDCLPLLQAAHTHDTKIRTDPKEKTRLVLT